MPFGVSTAYVSFALDWFILCFGHYCTTWKNYPVFGI